jgi:hypothetical protein
MILTSFMARTGPSALPELAELLLPSLPWSSSVTFSRRFMAERPLKERVLLSRSYWRLGVARRGVLSLDTVHNRYFRSIALLGCDLHGHGYHANLPSPPLQATIFHKSTNSRRGQRLEESNWTARVYSSPFNCLTVPIRSGTYSWVLRTLPYR